MRITLIKPFSFFVLLCALVLAGCDRHEKVVTKEQVLSELDIWVHTDKPEVLALVQDQVARFNAAHSRIRVSLTSIPRGTYNAQINAAIRTGTLPDILEVDGPLLYNFIERGVLIKLDKILTETTRRDILPTVFDQGVYQGRVYSLSTTSDSMVMYGRRSAIEGAGSQLPDQSRGWSAAEFERLLNAIKAGDNFAAAIDLGLGQNSERQMRAFTPLLVSAGGGVIDDEDPLESDGVINSRANRALLAKVQEWVKRGLVDRNNDGVAFAQQRVALTIESLDKYQGYQKQFGDDLVVLPLPDLGSGSIREQRGWSWALTHNCEDTQAAMRFLEFLFSPEEVLRAAEAGGLLPATLSALERDSTRLSATPEFDGLIVSHKKGGLSSQAKSPLYPDISKAFKKALIQISNGDAVDVALNRAVSEVDQARQKFEAMLVRLYQQREGEIIDSP